MKLKSDARSDFLTDTPLLVLHEFLRQRINLPWSEDFRAIGRVVEGKLVGVVGFAGFTGTACNIHMAGDGRWITREFIRSAFDYPFVTLRLDMVFGQVPSGNTVALAIDKRLGFTQLLYIPGGHPDGGLHLLQLTREAWMRSKFYGWQSARTAGPDPVR